MNKTFLAASGNEYEAVIGLEVHMQLLTNSKAYSADSAAYGTAPNTNVSVITLGHPGTLPRVNEKVIEYAVRLGLACGSTIREENHYARKNYFYADLPKGYQITQDTTPICTGGFITIKTKDGEKNIDITRIHMEEDAGKSIHDVDPFDTLIDLNRAGVALLEMVSEPQIKNADEAYAYLTEVRKLVQYLGICDGNMEEGSLRCDCNISVMRKGAKEFGKRVEVKNMNSFRNVQRAIEYEIKRQIEIIEGGGKISQDTHSFDAQTGTTYSMRSKEMAHDYRYFPEPDLPPVMVSEEFINSVNAKMPPLPNALIKKFIQELNLSEYDADVITESKEFALYFNELVALTENYKAAANFMIGPIKSYLNENAVTMADFPVKPQRIADLILLIDENKVSFSVASQNIFKELINFPEDAPSEIAERLNLLQDSNKDTLRTYVDEVLAKYPDKVKEYREGKTGLLGLFIGDVMKLSKGKADPKVTSELVKKALENN
jgi:aspartyl-tRNA(Asn)/glutamyl-tRNA(Gln) amidotransferase subunit B